MVNIIILNDFDNVPDKEVYVNIDNIAYFQKQSDGSTMICFGSADKEKNRIYVSESTKDIVKKIHIMNQNNG